MSSLMKIISLVTVLVLGKGEEKKERAETYGKGAI